MKDSPWWVEKVQPYQKVEEFNRGHQMRLAKEKLRQVLRHYGLDIDLDVWLDAQAADRWLPVRCPFHGDRRASASVSPNRLRFKCHACEMHGDAIDLAMEKECTDFKGAVSWINSL